MNKLKIQSIYFEHYETSHTIKNLCSHFLTVFVGAACFGASAFFGATTGAVLTGAVVVVLVGAVVVVFFGSTLTGAVVALAFFSGALPLVATSLPLVTVFVASATLVSSCLASLCLAANFWMSLW